MYYLIGRDLDADGQYEFVKDMENMILTEDPNSAIQMTETQLSYLDMEYLNEAGFYAMEADRFQVSILEKLLFSPLVMGYRPRVAPPPRRRRRPPRPVYRHAPHHRPAPPRRHTLSTLGVIGAILDPGPAHRPRRAPKPRPAVPRPRAAAPRPAVGRAPALPARPGAGRRGPGAGRTPGGRGGRGPGR